MPDEIKAEPTVTQEVTPAAVTETVATEGSEPSREMRPQNALPPDPTEDQDDEGYDMGIFQEAIGGVKAAPSIPGSEGDIDPVTRKLPPAVGTGVPAGEQVATTTTTPVPGSAPAAATTPIQQQPGVVPQQPVAPAVTQPNAQTATQTSAPADDEDPFIKIDRALEASKAVVIDAVAKQTYALTQEESAQLATEPETVIPKLMARVHVAAVQGVIRHISQQMPGMVNALLQARESNSKNENQFWERWPQLDKGKHGSDVMKAATLYRQMNPSAPADDFIRHVGAQVVMMHNLHQQQVAPAAQRQPVQAQPVPAPFSPAGIGSTSAPAVQVNSNPWAEMVEVMRDG